VTDSQGERRGALIASGIIAPVVVIGLLIRTGHWGLQGLDKSIVHRISGSRIAIDGHGFWVNLENIAETLPITIAFVAIVGWLAYRKRIRQAAWVAVAGLVTPGAWGLAKQIVDRPRPVVETGRLQIPGLSFPSGHSTEIATLMGVLIVLTWQGVKRPWLRQLLIGCWLVLIILVGADRVFLGRHYPSDVLAGWLLGVFIVFVSALAFGIVSPDQTVEDPRPLSSVPEQRRLLAIILNPIKIAGPDAFRARVGETVRAAGWDDPLWFETSIDDAGHAMARAAIAAGADVVVAAGGDGTVRIVCAEMAGTGIPVGIVPTGTGNLLARNLGLPLSHEAALDVVLNGQDRAIDIVRIEGDGIDETRYVVMAGLGLDAAIVAGAPDELKATMGWTAYVVSALKHVRYPAVRVSISIDGGAPVERRARTVVVGNVGSLQAGIPLLPDASIDDGVIDVVVLAPRRMAGWVGLVVRVMLRRRRTDDRLDRYTGRSVVIEAAHPTPRQLDGDTVDPGTKLCCEVEPGRLLVRVPR
jgi:diacylglycerol kinase family enzyme/membrane-associated phospholipid phosphatase